MFHKEAAELLFPCVIKNGAGATFLTCLSPKTKLGTKSIEDAFSGVEASLIIVHHKQQCCKQVRWNFFLLQYIKHVQLTLVNLFWPGAHRIHTLMENISSTELALKNYCCSYWTVCVRSGAVKKQKRDIKSRIKRRHWLNWNRHCTQKSRYRCIHTTRKNRIIINWITTE